MALLDVDRPDVSVEPGEFRRALAQFATGITVITALDREGAPYGVTATSFGSLSLEPPLIQWSLKTAAWSYPTFSRAPYFGVNILAADQEAVSRAFSSAGVDRFSVAAHKSGAWGAPLLEGCSAWLECALEDQLSRGDHTIFLGRVLQTTVGGKPPLLHWCGNYGVMSTPHDSVGN